MDQEKVEKVFDARAVFEVPIVSGGVKRCEVRFPTDQQWEERARRQKTIRRSLGRDKAQYEVSGMETPYDADIFKSICTNGHAAEFQGLECTKVLLKIGRCQVTNIESVEDSFVVEMKVAGIVVTHRLKMPSAQDQFEFSKAQPQGTVNERRNVSEFSNALAPSARLWDKLKVSTTGYAPDSPVPIIHKDAAITAVISEIRALEEEPDPEN